MRKVIDILNKKTDLTSLRFDKMSYSNVSFGCYLKSNKLIGKVRYYYKLFTYDIFKSEPANNFLGTRSTYENLKFISNPNKYKNYSIKDFDFDYIFYGLDELIPKYTIIAIKKMIKGRFNTWKNL